MEKRGPRVWSEGWALDEQRRAWAEVPRMGGRWCTCLIRARHAAAAQFIWPGLTARTCRCAAGVGMLIKIGGKSAEAPEVTLDGPERTPENVHVMKCSIKRGVRTTVFTMEFHIAEGKIRYLKNSRS